MNKLFPLCRIPFCAWYRLFCCLRHLFQKQCIQRFVRHNFTSLPRLKHVTWWCVLNSSDEQRWSCCLLLSYSISDQFCSSQSLELTRNTNESPVNPNQCSKALMVQWSPSLHWQNHRDKRHINWPVFSTTANMMHVHFRHSIACCFVYFCSANEKSYKWSNSRMNFLNESDERWLTHKTDLFLNESVLMIDR